MTRDVEIAIRVLAVLVMFTVGLDLRFRDFVRVREHPRLVLGVIVAHWVVLVLVGGVTGRLLALPDAVRAGMLLVAAAPAAALSCFYAQLAGGHLAIATTLTAVSSGLAAVATPLAANAGFSLFLAAYDRPSVALGPLVQQTLAGLALPLLAGMLVGHALAARLERWHGAVRAASLLAVLCMLAVVAVSQFGLIRSHFAGLVVAAATLTLAMLLVGFAVAAAIGSDASVRNALPWAFPARNAAVAMLLATGVDGTATTAAFVMVLFLVQVAVLVPVALWAARSGRRPLRAQRGDA